MTPRIPRTALLLLLGLALVLAGCSDDDTPTGSTQVAVDDYEHIDMNKDDGGLTTTDELVAFGDEELEQAALAADDMAVEDDQFAPGDAEEIEAEIARLRRMGEDGEGEGPHRPRFTYLRVKWGMLDAPERDAQDGDLLDWTGGLTVDRGIVVVRRVIRFERPFDHLVFPRLGPKTVAWVSHTGPHYDGLLIEIIERPRDEQGEEDLEPNRLHFETGPYTGSFLVSELPDLDEIVRVDETGNAIDFNGFTLQDLNACPRGFLSGRWAPLSEEQAAADTTGALGRFRGHWVGQFGRVGGYLRGAYGLNDEGERVFFGKYIDRLGRFRGILRGTWEPADDESRWASFEGVWAGAGGEVDGLLGGRAYHLPVHTGGFFEGRWATDCDPAAAEIVR